MKKKRKIIAYLAISADGYIARPDGDVEWLNRQPNDVDYGMKEFAQRLRATPRKQIWIMGGAGLIASFLDVGEIDEFDIHIIPVLIGDGIPLMAPRHRDIPLRLRSSKKFPDGIVRIRYEVVR